MKGSSKSLAVTVDNVIPLESEEILSDVVKVAKVLRNELLNHCDTWHLTGSMSYETPPMVAFFLKHLLFGTKSKLVSARREEAVNKVVNVVSQVLVLNVRMDKQVKHKLTSDVGFVTRIMTPQSVGLALSMHNKVRSKVLINLLSDLKLGACLARRCASAWTVETTEYRLTHEEDQ